MNFDYIEFIEESYEDLIYIDNICNQYKLFTLNKFIQETDYEPTYIKVYEYIKMHIKKIINYAIGYLKLFFNRIKNIGRNLLNEKDIQAIKLRAKKISETLNKLYKEGKLKNNFTSIDYYDIIGVLSAILEAKIEFNVTPTITDTTKDYAVNFTKEHFLISCLSKLEFLVESIIEKPDMMKNFYNKKTIIMVYDKEYLRELSSLNGTCTRLFGYIREILSGDTNDNVINILDNYLYDIKFDYRKFFTRKEFLLKKQVTWKEAREEIDHQLIGMPNDSDKKEFLDNKDSIEKFLKINLNDNKLKNFDVDTLEKIYKSYQYALPIAIKTTTTLEKVKIQLTEVKRKKMFEIFNIYLDLLEKAIKDSVSE